MVNEMRMIILGLLSTFFRIMITTNFTTNFLEGRKHSLVIKDSSMKFFQFCNIWYILE